LELTNEDAAAYSGHMSKLDDAGLAIELAAGRVEALGNCGASLNQRLTLL
jgi:hypothetical protein